MRETTSASKEEIAKDPFRIYFPLEIVGCSISRDNSARVTHRKKTKKLVLFYTVHARSIFSLRILEDAWYGHAARLEGAREKSMCRTAVRLPERFRSDWLKVFSRASEYRGEGWGKRSSTTPTRGNRRREREREKRKRRGEKKCARGDEISTRRCAQGDVERRSPFPVSFKCVPCSGSVRNIHQEITKQNMTKQKETMI